MFRQKKYAIFGQYYLFVVYLTRFFSTNSDYIASNKRISEWWIGKDVEKKRSWPNLRNNFDICLEGPRKTTNNLRRDSLSPGRYMNPGPPEYKAGVLTIQQIFVVHTGLTVETI
jgi:hypothetical protein